MKRELLAAALTAALILGAVINLSRVDRLNSDIMRCLDLGGEALSHSDCEGAEKAVTQALGLWLEAEGYTHIFIRHSEIDATTDAFYEALGELGHDDCESSIAAMDKLRYHLDSLCQMEHLSLGSIL